MRIFSETLNSFRAKQATRLRKFIKEATITSTECRTLEYRFRAPKLYIFAHDETLGSYHSNSNTIQLNKTLITSKQEVIDDILKHELAHYFAIAKYGNNIKSHGKEFKEFCTILGCSAAAKTNIEMENKNANTSIKEEAMLEKVKKLFKLGESPNEAESQSAIRKANELIEKYNLKYLSEDCKEFYQEVVYRSSNSRVTNKYTQMAFFAKELFGIHPIWGRENKHGVIYFNGTRENINIASYVFDYLDKEIERLYKLAKNTYKLSGVAAKNNYIDGLLQTYISNIKQARRESYSKGPELESYELATQSLTAIRKTEHKQINKLIFDNKLKRTFDRGRRGDANAKAAGSSDSTNLQINKGVSHAGVALIAST